LFPHEIKLQRSIIPKILQLASSETFAGRKITTWLHHYHFLTFKPLMPWNFEVQAAAREI
jgi:hypothetical protein